MNLGREKDTTENDRGRFSLPPNFRWNFYAILVDYVFFGVAFSFISPSTVLPAFVGTLTDSEPLIGLVGTVLNAGWLLPQAGIAAAMAAKTRKKPYLMLGIHTGRPLFFLLALAVWAGLATHPAAMLGSFFACIGLFTLSDSVSSLAWFDILARAVPMERRGRLLGAAQVIGGVLGIGVGALVSLVLGSPSLPYPRNYALLFAMAAVAFLPSTIALSLIREPTGIASEPNRSLVEFLARLGDVWREDPLFRRLMAHRWLVGLLELAIFFYILHAIESVGLPEASTGWFVSANMVGVIVASVGLGWLSERKGPRPVIWIGSLTALLSPVVALSIHFAPSLSWAYPLVYFLLGMTHSFWMLGPTNYLLEMAPEDRRPLYVGLYNTMAGLLVPASFLGGVLLQATSYPVLFSVTAVGVAIGLWLSLSLQDLRGRSV